ncbi:hypothetical protein NQ315_002444 [Exocentrus adspersus]|uniref:EB domain-containing protein n=1 Tax=Exocentrus adspersus TaxID=1586481 RepID=A0AAV8VHV3_9CUCU|nr:hypothetical protein NQ315_002444 [Exocentrus adspersus]
MSEVLYKLVVVFTICIDIVYMQSFDQGEARLVTYHKCLLDNHCQDISPHSFCYDNDNNRMGRCKCIDGYELLSRNRTYFACLKNANWEEPCEKDIQCYYLLSTNAKCDETDGVCKCAESAHRFTDGRCYKSIKLGDFCQVDGNCFLKDGTFGGCVDGRCECKRPRELPTEDAMGCIEARNLGEVCENDDQCSYIPNAVCRVSCKCAPGYALSRDGTRCLKGRIDLSYRLTESVDRTVVVSEWKLLMNGRDSAATKFFESCEENAQCSEFLQGSFCNEGNCTCSDGHHGYGSKCAKTAGIGGSCTGTEECIPEEKYSQAVNCVDGTCQCLAGTEDTYVGCNACMNSVSLTVGATVCFLYLLFCYY